MRAAPTTRGRWPGAGADRRAPVPQTIFDPKGTNAEKINKLQVPVFIAAGVVGLIVGVMLVFVMVTGRRRRRTDDDDPKQIHGNTRVEIGWTIVPFLILLAVAVPTVATLISIDRTPADAMKISVFGQQWWWAYQYDVNGDGIPEVVTANELVIPAGKADHARSAVARRDPQLLDPGAQRQARRGAGSRPDAADRRRPARRVPGPVHGVLRAVPRQHAHARAIALTPSDFDRWLVTSRSRPPTPAAGSQAAAGLDVVHSQVRAVPPDQRPSTTSKGTPRWSPAYAPNLTHLMSRTMFAERDCSPLYVTGRRTASRCFNRQPARGAGSDDPSGGCCPIGRRPEGRGMPNLQLTETEIDQLDRLPPDARPVPAGRRPRAYFFAMRF